jgi:hypothetical protein
MFEIENVERHTVIEATAPWLDFLARASESIPSAIIGSAIGAGLAMWFTISLNRQEQRRRLTQAFIDELLSPSFLIHRIALGDLRDQFDANPHLIERFAHGFWYPGRKEQYLGEKEGLNLHQHFEVSKGWVRRLAHALRNDRINRDDIKATLSDSYRWMDAVLYPVAKEVSKQIADASREGIEVGSVKWLDDVHQLSKFFGFQKNLL